MFDNVIVVYKTLGDLMFYVTGSHDENELILYTVLQGFYESVSLLLRYVIFQTHCLSALLADDPFDNSLDAHMEKLKQLCCCRGAVEKKTVLENLDLVLLSIDEIIDGG